VVDEPDGPWDAPLLNAAPSSTVITSQQPPRRHRMFSPERRTTETIDAVRVAQ
jgi:hypothetical protein